MPQNEQFNIEHEHAKSFKQNIFMKYSDWQETFGTINLLKSLSSDRWTGVNFRADWQGTHPLPVKNRQNLAK